MSENNSNIKDLATVIKTSKVIWSAGLADYKGKLITYESTVESDPCAKCEFCDRCVEDVNLCLLCMLVSDRVYDVDPGLCITHQVRLKEVKNLKYGY